MIVIRYIHWNLSLTKQIFGTVAPSLGSDSVVAGLLLLPSCVGFLAFSLFFDQVSCDLALVLALCKHLFLLRTFLHLHDICIKDDVEVNICLSNSFF